MAMQKMLVDIEMLDGTEFEDIRIIWADMMRYSDTARRRKWGPMEEDKLTATGFMAFAAMQRLGLYSADKGFDTFNTEVAMIYSDDDAGAVDPTTAETSAD
ncbi:hypothetical protein [Corynebacterium kalidii]